MVLFYMINLAWIQRKWTGEDWQYEFKDDSSYYYAANLYTEDSLYLGDWGWELFTDTRLHNIRTDGVAIHLVESGLVISCTDTVNKHSHLSIYRENEGWEVGEKIGNCKGINNLIYYRNNIYCAVHFTSGPPKIYRSPEGTKLIEGGIFPPDIPFDTITSITKDKIYLYVSVFSSKTNKSYIFYNSSPEFQTWEPLFNTSSPENLPLIEDMAIINIDEGGEEPTKYLYACGEGRMFRINLDDAFNLIFKWEEISTPSSFRIHGIHGIIDKLIVAGEEEGEGCIYMYEPKNNQWNKIFTGSHLSTFLDFVGTINGILAYGEAKDSEKNLFLYFSESMGTEWEESGYIPDAQRVIAGTGLGNLFYVLDDKSRTFHKTSPGDKFPIGILQSSIFDTGIDDVRYGKIHYWFKGGEKSVKVKVQTIPDLAEPLINWDEVEDLASGDSLLKSGHVMEGDRYIVYYVVLKPESENSSPVFDSISIEYFSPGIEVGVNLNKDTVYQGTELGISVLIINKGYEIVNNYCYLNSRQHPLQKDSTVGDTATYLSTEIPIDKESFRPGEYILEVYVEYEDKDNRDIIKQQKTFYVRDSFQISIEEIPTEVKRGDIITFNVNMDCSNLDGFRKIDSIVVFLNDEKYGTFTETEVNINTENYENSVSGWIYAYSSLGEEDSLPIQFSVIVPREIIENFMSYPNPVRGDYLTISFITREKCSMKILLYSVDGFLIYREKRELSNIGNQEKILIPVSELDSGVYYLYVEFYNEGKRDIYKRTIGVVK